MKRVTAIGLLILIALAMLAMLISCDNRADTTLTDMKSPVVLIGKYSFETASGNKQYHITLMDATGRVVTLHNEYTLSKTIGTSYNIKDTIK